MSTTQEEKYKRRYERLVKQLATLYGSPLNTSTTTLQLVAVEVKAGGFAYAAKVCTATTEYETIASVFKRTSYPEDVVAVIGQEVRRQLRERIRNARTALR